MNTAPPNSTPPPRDSIATISASLQCFGLSLLGLVPLLGLPFALAATVRSREVRRAVGATWNPAGRYLNAAARIGPLGFLATAVFLVLCFGFTKELRDLMSCSFGST